jgi:exopolysaccharide production protein ExoZ
MRLNLLAIAGSRPRPPTARAPERKSAGGTIVSVQYLRGIAALLVVYAHVATQVLRYGNFDLPLYEYGHVGVDLFFVISGFIMWQTTFDKRMSPVTFFYRRLTRIVPAYWIVTSVVVLVSIFVPSALTSTRFEWAHVLASYFFVPMRHPVLTHYYFPILIVGWTLNYEMFFYLIFSFCLYLARFWRVVAVVAALAAMVLYGLVGHPSGVAEFYTNSIVLEFAFGVVAGYALTDRQLLSPMAAMALAVLLFCLANYVEAPRVLAFGLPALFLVYASTACEKSKGGFIEIRPLKLLGDASYSLYLTHALTLAVFAKAWVHIGLRWGPAQTVSFVVLSLLSATVVGIAVYYCIEAPIHAFFRTYRAARKSELGGTGVL